MKVPETKNKEKIVFALHSEPLPSPSRWLGAEVAIGKLTKSHINRLRSDLEKEQLFTKTKNLFSERTFFKSDYLSDLMDVSDKYHRNGLLFVEDLEDDCQDRNEYSTENWVLTPPNDEDPNYRRPNVIKLDDGSTGNALLLANADFSGPASDVVVVSIRLMDLYFQATGVVEAQQKVELGGEIGFHPSGDCSEGSRFHVSTGVDDFFYLMESLGFGGFSLLTSAFVGDTELERRDGDEDMEGAIYDSNHLLIRDGEIIGWLASNNGEFKFPFADLDNDVTCICPNLKQEDSAMFDWAVKDLVTKLGT